MTRILLIAKRVARDRFSDADLDRLQAVGIDRRGALEGARADHLASLEQIRRTLAPYDIDECLLDEVNETRVQGRDLVVCVGGDGTVLASHRLTMNTPVLAVNSDPHRSLGHYTRCTVEHFSELLEQFLSGRSDREMLPRLSVQLDGNFIAPVINDCLITNHNSAMMSNYRIVINNQSEVHYSSGLWISTGAGSSGGIASAGMDATDPSKSALLYKVREAFPGRGPYNMLADCQQPARGIAITPLVPGMHCYIDGGQPISPAVACGETVQVEPFDHPLQLITR